MQTGRYNGASSQSTFCRQPAQTFPFPVLFLAASIDSIRHRSSLRHTCISERNFSSHFSMDSRGILSTLAVKKPSAGSTKPVRAPGPLDPMTLSEAGAVRVTNCAHDAERNRASRGPILPPYHLLRLHLRCRPRRSLSRAAGSRCPPHVTHSYCPHQGRDPP